MCGCTWNVPLLSRALCSSPAAHARTCTAWLVDVYSVCSCSQVRSDQELHTPAELHPAATLLPRAGQKLYDLAREGKTVEVEARPVSVPQYDVWREEEGSQTVHFRVTCSKGTYIRWVAGGCAGTLDALMPTHGPAVQIRLFARLEGACVPYCRRVPGTTTRAPPPEPPPSPALCTPPRSYLIHDLGKAVCLAASVRPY